MDDTVPRLARSRKTADGDLKIDGQHSDCVWRPGKIHGKMGLWVRSFSLKLLTRQLISCHSFAQSYHVIGHRFTHLNSSIRFYRTIIRPQTTEREELSAISSDASDEPLLDASGAYIVEVSVRVQDGTKVEQAKRGMTELLNLKETLKGAIELDAGDRLALDTRMR